MDDKIIAASEKTNLMNLRSKRRKWTQDEIKLFLKCFLARQHEFISRKKKFAYQSVLKDMIEQGFKDKNTSHSNLECKMRTLSIAYKACKDKIFPKKASAYIKPFIEELDMIFGNQVNIMAQATTDSAKVYAPEKSESENDNDSDSLSSNDDPLQASDDAAANVKSDTEYFDTAQDDEEGTSKNSTDANILDSVNNNKLSAQHEYYEAKLEYKRRDLALKMKFYDKMISIEKEKLELLTKIADKLCKA